ncbi:MAG: HAD family hydrolase [Candidatus Omnitrophica bacterium]|nr:HAD family hydrolase [Candidatus Omnitrophota bacterium]MBU1997699.1 HAD family hydrolase [Candidatus Omnitrophota bacterium]MBU4334733.1 HAD family hydrolase [Candidatus Omnitrophota bacterium]
MLPRSVVQKVAEDYVKRFVQDVKIEEVCFRVFEEVDEIILSYLNSFIKPIDGANELLNQLRNRGCKLAIATTDKTERAELALKHLGISDLFDIVVGADKVEKSKPDS